MLIVLQDCFVASFRQKLKRQDCYVAFFVAFLHDCFVASQCTILRTCVSIFFEGTEVEYGQYKLS